METIGPLSTPHGPLQHEQAVLDQLRGIQGIPDIVWPGTESGVDVLVFENSGPTLEVILKSSGRRMSVSADTSSNRDMLQRKQNTVTELCDPPPSSFATLHYVRASSRLYKSLTTSSFLTSSMTSKSTLLNPHCLPFFLWKTIFLSGLTGWTVGPRRATLWASEHELFPADFSKEVC